MSRTQIENIVMRSMEIRRLNVSPEETKAAILDVILEHAIALCDKTAGLVKQSHGGTKDQIRIARKMCAEWRATIKGVKAVLGDHKIAEHHLNAAIASYPLLVSLLPDLKQVITSQERWALRYCTDAAQRRAMLRKLLTY